MTKTLTPEAQARREAQKAKIKATNAAKRALRTVPLLELPPYRIIRADDSNIAVLRTVRGENGKAAESNEGWWPLSLVGFEAAIGWCLAQKATGQVERAKTTLSYLGEILAEVKAIAAALMAKEVGR